MSTKLDNALIASDQWIRKEVSGGDEFCHRCPFHHSIQSNSLTYCPSTHITLSPIISFRNRRTWLDDMSLWQKISFFAKPTRGPIEQIHQSETFSYPLSDRSETIIPALCLCLRQLASLEKDCGWGFGICQGCRYFETSVFFSVKINISTMGGFRVGFFQPDTNHP